MTADEHHTHAFSLDDQKEFSVIVAGAGTAGCTTAYFIASIMEQNDIPGTVLLLDRGPGHSPQEGPDPRMPSWFHNWGSFGESHPSFRTDGTDYPVTASSHNGVGGCGTHDTRITFAMRPEQRKRVAKLMGWDSAKIDAYFQAALNLMPLSRSVGDKEQFYEEWIKSMTDSSKHAHPLHRTQDDTFPARIMSETIAEPMLAMYEDELRWTSAHLLSSPHCPANLRIVTHAAVDRIIFSSEDDAMRAEGAVVMIHGKKYLIPLAKGGELALTGGTLGNVGILQRSGIGPKDTLQELGIHCVVDNPEVGHGIDHPEIVVMYEWLDKWLDADGQLPRGGATGWPLIMFSSSQQGEFMCHAGAGYAEPYTMFPSVVGTPNCMHPDPSAGYRASITSLNPMASLNLIHAEQPKDYLTMAGGVQRTVELFEYLRKDGVVGKRILPPAEMDLTDVHHVADWVRDHHFTVFHWACTTKAGVRGSVADEHFRVRSTALPAKGQTGLDQVICNLRVGSASALPELSEANPHLSITSFSIALADDLCRDLARFHQIGYTEPVQLAKAKADLNESHGELVVRKPGEEVPALRATVEKYAADWLDMNE